MQRLAALASVDRDLEKLEINAKRAFARFRTWHVETNLNKAADLLDRCLMERGSHNALRAQAALMRHTLWQEADLLKTEEARVASGYLDESTNQAVAKAQRLEFQTEKYLPSIDQYVVGAALAANGQTPGTTVANQAMVDQYRNYIYKANFADDTANAVAQAKLVSEEVSRQKSSVVEARVRLKDKVSLVEGDGPLAYEHHATAIRQRIVRDFDEATDRVIVASEGLKDIFSYASPFVLDYGTGVGSDPLERLDATVLWVRDAIRWLAEFSQLDQAFSIAISLRKTLVGSWENALAGAPSSFRVPDTLFADHRLVRLRGISVTSVFASADPSLLWCRLSVPKHAVYVKGGVGNADATPIEQGSMPSCTLGRVADLRIPLQLEVAGSISLMNASPIGQSGDGGEWGIRIGRGFTFSKVELVDLVVELRVTGRPR